MIKLSKSNIEGGNMRLMAKVAGLVAVLLCMTLIVSIYASVNMNKTGKKIDSIAGADIPLLEAITKVTFSQLEQSAWIERGLTAAGRADWDEFAEADAKLMSLDLSITEQFRNITQTLSAFIEDSEDVDYEKYQALSEALVKVQSEYRLFIDGSREILSLILSGEISREDVDLMSVRSKVKDMSAALLGLTAQISVSTSKLATVAQRDEEYAIDAMILISIIAMLLGIGLSVWILRGIDKQLGGDPSELVKIADALAVGDLQVKRNVDASGVYGSINQITSNLIQIISGIKSGAQQVHEAAEQVSQGNANLSQRTQEQASSLEEVASSMEEMTGTINQNAENAQLTNQLTGEAREQAEKGVEVADNAISAMNEIEESSKKIAAIISVIDEIAFQTNLLALNAAVEAARAGEQGRGFAVVASEVRNLAGRSATAAKEIKDLIHDSVDKVEDGTRLVDETGRALSGIVASVKKASLMSTEIAAASKEQSEGIEQVNKALLQMDEMTQQNASLVEQAAAASEAMGAQAQELTDLVSFFNVDGDMSGRAADVAMLSNDSGNAEHKKEEPPKALPKSNTSSSDDGEWEDF